MATYTSDMFSESESDAQVEEAGMEEATELRFFFTSRRGYAECTFVSEHEESIHEELRRTPTPVNAPKFITKLKDVRAKRGGSALFECVVPDTKGVCCKWLKDGKVTDLRGIS